MQTAGVDAGARSLIYIPAYNAEKKIVQVLDRIPEQVAQTISEVLVVDNASEDATLAVTRAYSRQPIASKIRIISNQQNLGYGGSQKLAYRYADENGFDAVVMLHADGQYAPEKIEQILGPCERGEADMVFGSRLAGDPLKGSMPLIRYWGNHFLTSLANLVLRWNLTEYHSGYRAYRVAALRKIPFQLNADYFHFDVDILVQLKCAGLRVAEVPIPTHYGDETSHLNVWRTGFSILGILAEYVFHTLGLRRIAKFNVKAN
jgi:glycosyltransferase involved in cell wall biosynthesis